MEKKITDRQYVIRACQIKGVDLLSPKKNSPEIIGTFWADKDGREFGYTVIDALTWLDAKRQINEFFATRSSAW